MSMRLRSNRPAKGTDAAALRKWGIIFLTLGTIGRCLLQNRLLGVGTVSSDELFNAMQSNAGIMGIATLSLFLQIIETCAAPLFTFLLVEGFLRTSSFEKYLLRIGGVALVSELPYNLAYTGKLLDLTSRNPVFGLFICLIMLYFFSKYAEKGFKNTAMKTMIFVAAFLWCLMLHIDQGICLVAMVAFLWAVREKSNIRAMCGFCSAMVCTLFDMFYIGSCLSFIMLHKYNEERGEQNEKLNYAFYPVMLLLVGVAGMFLK